MGPLSGKRRTVGWEGRRVWCGKPAPPRLYPPPVLIKDRWIGPREQVLNVPIACWYTSLVSLVVCHQQKVALPPLLQWLPWGEKLGMNPWIDQSLCCELGREPFFSGAVTLSIAVDEFVKSCYTWAVWDIYDRGSFVDWAWKACDVLIGFFPTGYTSIQIAGSLGYE
jgi:hypothetical protein